jgi:membrane protease subunit (stomatin/prohibitin family)
MAFIDMVKWDTSNDVFAWKYPEQNLSTFTQLVVHETQEAVLFSKGQLLQKFGAGKHTLNTENIPLLRNVFGIPFGGKNPFTAEVWFVNRASPLNLPWRTDSMRYKDPSYNAMVPLMAEGQYGLQVQDAEKFLLKLVGTVPSFNSRDLAEHFRGELVSKTKSTIVAKMMADHIGIMEISAYLHTIGEFLKAEMAAFWSDNGFKLINFYITSVDIDDTTPDGIQILQSIANRSTRDIEGFTYQQERTFDTRKTGAAGSNAMGLGLGMAMGQGLGQGLAGNMGSTLMNPTSAPLASGVSEGTGSESMRGTGITAGQTGKNQVFCAKCGTKTGGAKFCPGCGKPYLPCLNCGADNLQGAVKCVMCSQALGQKCPKCGVPLAVDARFCPSCGENLKKVCSTCGTPVSASTKYCPNCGGAIQ